MIAGLYMLALLNLCPDIRIPYGGVKRVSGASRLSKYILIVFAVVICSNATKYVNRCLILKKIHTGIIEGQYIIFARGG